MYISFLTWFSLYHSHPIFIIVIMANKVIYVLHMILKG